MTLSRTPGVEARFALFYFCLFSVFAAVTPYFQVLLRAQGFSKSSIGFIFGVLETIGLLAPPLWGWISDHSRHRRSLLAFIILASGATFLLFGWIADFWLAAGAALLFGFFYRPIIPLTDGFVLRYLSEHGGDYGRPRAAGSVAFIATVSLMELAGVARGTNQAAIILSAVAGCSLVHALCVAALPLTATEVAEREGRIERPQRHFEWAIFRSAPFVVFTLISFMGRFAMMSYYSFFSLYLREAVGFQEVGWLWALGPLAEIPVIFFSGRIIRRIGVRNLFALGIAGIALRLIGYSLAPSVWAIIPLQFLHALTFGAYHTSSLYYINRLVPSHMKQSATSIFASISLGVSAIVSSAVGGVVIDHFGFRAMYASYGALAVVAFALIFLVLKPVEAPGSAEKP